MSTPAPTVPEQPPDPSGDWGLAADSAGLILSAGAYESNNVGQLVAGCGLMEGVLVDRLHAVGQLDLLQPREALEGMGAHNGDLPRDRDHLQTLGHVGGVGLVVSRAEDIAQPGALC